MNSQMWWKSTSSLWLCFCLWCNEQSLLTCSVAELNYSSWRVGGRGADGDRTGIDLNSLTCFGFETFTEIFHHSDRWLVFYQASGTHCLATLSCWLAACYIQIKPQVFSVKWKKCLYLHVFMLSSVYRFICDSFEVHRYSSEYILYAADLVIARGYHVSCVKT